MRTESAVEPHAHALGAFERHHLGDQDVRKLAGAAAESERAEPADGAGVAVGHRVRRARQYDAELRRHHVRNALLGIVDIEQPDAVIAAALAHRLDERGARGVGIVVAAGPGRHGVILHREGQVGPVHFALLLLQLRKGMMGVQFVQHVAIDIDEIAAVGALADAVEVPDFVEQSGWHGG